MTTHCSIDVGSVIEPEYNMFYWYCNTCKEYHKEIFNDDVPPYVVTITDITKEEYNTLLTYLRL